MAAEYSHFSCTLKSVQSFTFWADSTGCVLGGGSISVIGKIIDIKEDIVEVACMLGDSTLQVEFNKIDFGSLWYALPEQV